MVDERELYETPAPVEYRARGGAIRGFMIGFRYGIVTNRRLYFEDRGQIDQFLLSRVQSLSTISGKEPFLQIDLADGCRLRVSLNRDTASRLAEEVTGAKIKESRLLVPIQEAVLKDLSSEIQSAMSSVQPERARSGCPLAGRCTCGCALCYISGPVRGASAGHHCGTHRGHCHARCR